MVTMTTTVARITPNLTSSVPTSEEEGASDDPTPEQKLAVICILSVLCVFGTCGNGLVLYVFSSKGNKVTSTIFILALAWTDIFTCSVIIPLTIAFTATDGDLRVDFLCKLYQFLITFNVPLAAFIMVAIAVDRYFSICHPFLHAVTPKRARLTVCFLCIFAFSLGTITALGYGYGPILFPSASNSTSLSSEENLAAEDALTTSTATAISSRIVERQAREETPKDVVYMCQPKGNILSYAVLQYYQKFYASFYLLSLLAVFIIYAFIYRSVVRRREWRRRQRSNRPPSKSPVTIATDVEEVELRAKNGSPALNGGGNEGNGNGNVGCSETQSLNSSEKKASKERRDFNFLANIRTAAMLFVVTLVFIVSFLPAWLMAVRVLDYQIIIFYLYFIYNVANPVIYAFMNHAFRKELKRVFQRGIHLCRA